MVQGRSPARRLLFGAIVLLIWIYLLCPFYWAINTSLKSNDEIVRTPATFWPHNPTWQHYRAVLDDGRFTRGLLNSARVAGASVLLSLAVGSLAAYALAKFHFRGRRVWLYLALAMTLFPPVSILVPLYAIIRRFQIDAMLGMILSYLIFTLPFTVWILTSFFRALPDELLEAAWIDGASPFQAFYMVLLPLAAPALVTAALLAFIVAWNEYLFALTFTTTQQDAWTVPIAISFYLGVGPFYGDLMAATMVVTAPIIALALIFQRRIVKGLTAGAVSG